MFPFVSILAQTFSISQTGYDSHQSHIQILDSNLLNLFLSLSSLRQVQLHHFSLQRFLWCLIIYKILAQVPYNSSQLLGSKWFYIFLTWIQIIFQCLPLNHCITAFWNSDCSSDSNLKNFEILLFLSHEINIIRTTLIFPFLKTTVWKEICICFAQIWYTKIM